MPAGRSAGAAGGTARSRRSPVASGPAATLGLRTFDLGVAPSLTTNTHTLTNVRDQHAADRDLALRPRRRRHEPGRAGAAARRRQRHADRSERRPARRRLPRRHLHRLRPVVPLTGAPTTELRGVHAPFVSPVFFPMRLSTVNYFGALGGSGGTNLLVTPAQHRVADVALGNEHAAPLLEPRPAAVLQRQPDRRRALRRAHDRRRRRAARGRRRRLHRPGRRRPGRGDPLRSGSPTRRRRHVDVARPAAVRRAAARRVRNGRGLAALEGPARRRAGRPQVRRPGGERRRPRLARRQPRLRTTGSPERRRPRRALALVSPPASGTFGDSTTVTAALTDPGGAPLAGKMVTIAVGGGSAAIGVTGADGRVTLGVPLTTVPGSYQLVGLVRRRHDARAVLRLGAVCGREGAGEPVRVHAAAARHGRRRHRAHVDPHRGPGRQAAAPAAADRDLHAHRAGRDEDVLDDHRLPRARDAAADRTSPPAPTR